MMKERDYIYAQDLTRLRIAYDVLCEVVHEDFKVKHIVDELYKQFMAALVRTEVDTSDSNGEKSHGE